MKELEVINALLANKVILRKNATNYNVCLYKLIKGELHYKRIDNLCDFDSPSYNYRPVGFGQMFTIPDFNKPVSTDLYSIYEEKPELKLKWESDASTRWTATNGTSNFYQIIKRKHTFVMMLITGSHETDIFLGACLILNSAKEICQKHFEGKE